MNARDHELFLNLFLDAIEPGSYSGTSMIYLLYIQGYFSVVFEYLLIKYVRISFLDFIYVKGLFFVFDYLIQGANYLASWLFLPLKVHI